MKNKSDNNIILSNQKIDIDSIINSEFERNKIEKSKSNNSELSDDKKSHSVKPKTKFSNQNSKNNININDLTYFIILADDNHLINTCNERIIEGIMSELNLFKYEVIKVSDGLDVIKIFLNNEVKDKIKLIITDENMDYFNGSEMIKFLRKVERLMKLNPIKIASVSSEDDIRHKDYLINCGADFVFSKPLSKSNVKAALLNN